MARARHRLRVMKRFALPAPWRWRYIAEAKRSGLFDRTFYRGANPSLHALFRAFPERHYVTFGEAMGLRPNPDFSPRAYVGYNPDLKGQPAPFLHYLRAGRHEDRITKELPPVDECLPVRPPVLRGHARTAEFAVVVHIYYHEMWDEIAETLAEAGVDHDLFVTLTHKGAATEALMARIRESHPGAVLVPMPNHGRDIFPFLHLVNAGVLDGYRAICKLHTKKSPHRQDGDHWRRHLIGGILPGADTGPLLDRFLADPNAAFWVADGQHYTGDEWWGCNRQTVTHLLRRVEIRTGEFPLSFPAGSIYWLKPLMIAMLRGMALTEAIFEPEEGQVDGTLAHAVERALGHLVQAAGMTIAQTSQLIESGPPAAPVRPAFVTAAYLPQFHPTPENDAWWGKGFTEWTNVIRATPQFPGHRQPMLPGETGFYDLRLPEVMGMQARMARAAGVDAFCVYHYWFDGRRVLHEPLNRLLAETGTDFPFYLCWANESWRRNWDGLSGEVLMEQTYAEGFEAALAQDLMPYMSDPRYARPDGRRPRFVIYRPEDMPDPETNVARLRAAWRELGLGQVEIGAVRFHVGGEAPVAPHVFDFWIEMPPHGLVHGQDFLFGGPGGNRLGFDVAPGFEGLIYDYAGAMRNSLAPDRGRPKNLIAGVMPSWDNTARRGNRGHVAYGANPARFHHWLSRIGAARLPASYRGELFINAWNEWAEKAMLEPSEQYGRACLDVLAQWTGTGKPGGDGN
ncbi:glycoside hydrolase family 99-like domain-containing protein [Acidimangrovimonas sediminis]|uniref:glycoside hydrolase family 99-like domain-containing protein n=1 Tax=Acidimangrovimonas sediminis TaxID=2056283 RepID=UPI0038BC4B00